MVLSRNLHIKFNCVYLRHKTAPIRHAHPTKSCRSEVKQANQAFSGKGTVDTFIWGINMNTNLQVSPLAVRCVFLLYYDCLI